MIYTIADFNININFIYPRTEIFLSGYENTNAKNVDFEINVTEADIDIEERKAIELTETPRYSRIYLERLAILRKINETILSLDSFLIHGALIEYDGRGYLFCAPSGVGKTTHILLWQQLFGKDNVRIINGDKPLVRLIDGKFYAYGTPWCGKEGYNINARTELCGICFIKRAERNSIERITDEQALKQIFAQIEFSRSKEFARQLEVIGDMIDRIPMYMLYCNKEKEAAAVAYDAMK